MKKSRIFYLMLYASAGAMVCAGSGILANDSVQGRQADLQQSQDYQIQKATEINSQPVSNAEVDAQIIDEPAGAERTLRQTTSSRSQSFGQVHKASDLIGMEVRNQQNEKLGDIRDVVIDLNSGRIPFAVLSSDVGERLVVLPPSQLNTGAGGQRLTLDMDRERLRGAPSFERNRWPDMANQQWSSEVYRFYGAEPYWQSSNYQTMQQPYQERSEVYSESFISEPAGGQPYSGGWERGEVPGITRLDDISSAKTRGGAVDLQPFAHRNEGMISQSQTWQRYPDTRETYRETQHQTRPAAQMSHTGRFHRASDLIGMNVKNAQNETVGEIKDVVLDLNSGHVAYTVLSADRFLNTRGELIAVPPSLFTHGADTRTVMLNANRNTLMNAPRFDRDNWNQVSNEKFVSRVYSHYGQQPYWQAQGQFQPGPQFRDPSGAELNQQQDQSLQPDATLQQQQELRDPAGAEQQKLNPQEGQQFQQNRQLQQEQPERSISEPADIQPQSQVLPEGDSPNAVPEAQDTSSSAPSAGFEAQPDVGAVVQEPAGAQPEAVDIQRESQNQIDNQSIQPEANTQLPQIVEPAGAGLDPSESVGTQSKQPNKAQQALDSHAEQVREAAGASTSNLDVVKQVRSSIQGDSALGAQNVQVTSEQGKIVLRGSVDSETQRQQILERAQKALLDNQIQVQGSQPIEPQSQP